MRAVLFAVKGCLMVALLLFGGPSAAQSDPLPRADIVSCVRAVDGLDVIMRAKMQSHCLVIASNHCEAPASGPILRCLSDLTQAMNAFVVQSRVHLPSSIEAQGFRPRAYRATLERLDAQTDPQTQCATQHSRAFNQTICESVAAFGRLTDIFLAARYAGIELP